MLPIMLPFDMYPGHGRELFGQLAGDNCHHGYGPELMRLTRQRRCAYCGLDFTRSYGLWISMSLDHVVPTQLAERLGIPRRLWNDYANCVLACCGCNHLRNRAYENEAPDPPPGDLQTDEQLFFAYRDIVFRDRYWCLAQSRMAEMAHFDQRPWEHDEQEEP